MFWWFERGGAYTRCEILQLPTGMYELRVIEPSGVERIEEFTNAVDLAKRQKDVEQDLVGNGWTGPHGWVL